MRRVMSARLGVLALFSSTCIMAGSAAHAQGFLSIIDPANPTFTQALSLNSSNTIVGYGNATTFNGFTLKLPPVAGNFTRLNVPGATGGTQVTGIDTAGDTVGFSISGGGVTSGFANTGGQGGTFTTVFDPGFAFTQLLGISSNGSTAAGYWSADTAGLTGQLAGVVTGGPGFASPSFVGINSALVAKFGPNFNSQATGVNNGGWIVGFYQLTPNSSPTFNGFVDEAGVLSNIIAPFAGTVSTQALGVNDFGWIVGDYTLSNGDMFGFLDKGGVFTTIDPFGSTTVTANGINDKGVIVGFYGDANGDTIGFTTVPEPSTWAMMALGFAGLSFAGYRKAQRRGALA